jgi:hypothetical protein
MFFRDESRRYELVLDVGGGCILVRETWGWEFPQLARSIVDRQNSHPFCGVGCGTHRQKQNREFQIEVKNSEASSKPRSNLKIGSRA